MEIQTVSYHKVFNLGNYSNEKIGVEIKLSAGEDPLDAFAEAKKLVEKSHKFFQDLPTYERAKKIVSDADNNMGRDVKAAQEVMKAFESNYPDYMGRFMPVSRQIEQGVLHDEDFDDN